MLDVQDDTGDLTRIRFAARFEVDQHHAEQTGELTPLESLVTKAKRHLGPTDYLTFRIECGLEEVRSRRRAAAASADAWDDLYLRASAHLNRLDRVLMRIESFHAQYTRRRGDIEGGIQLYRDALAKRSEALGENTYDTHMTRGNLAFALLDSGEPAYLDEALAILEAEVSYRTTEYGPESEFACRAAGNLGRALVRRYERDVHDGVAEPDTGSLHRALAIATEQISIRDRRNGRTDAFTSNAHLLRAHALLLLDRRDDARTELKFVAAVVEGRRVPVEQDWLAELTARLEQ
ncbi:hypothetical protein [Dactylosporangium sp. CA-139066]|uniref:hypothetical protein n=1 Tax=Dactylosporangium sp. CA-139066 TaxID=3239930 RepID=UPI003D8C1729